MNNNTNTVHSLTLYVIFSILVLLVYTIVEQILSSTTGINHDTLTTCIFAAFGGEILACAVIKIFKLKSTDTNGEDES
jgi:hypothetical protein